MNTQKCFVFSDLSSYIKVPSELFNYTLYLLFALAHNLKVLVHTMKLVQGLKSLLQKRFYSRQLYEDGTNLKPPWRVMFYGTDDFSLACLNALCMKYKNKRLISNLEVVTLKRTKFNSVHKYALKENLVLHNWPINPLDCNRFHIGVVVSFGHLIPEDVIKNFSLGMINVHASLLPRWRGAAPAIYALANDDEETGISVMKIKPNKYDIGEIISQTRVKILPQIKLPQLLDTLAELGANELIKVLEDLPFYLKQAKPQPQEGVTYGEPHPFESVKRSPPPIKKCVSIF
ncbi:hypothetical protein FQA39_LY04227 [Lamprigera yunnana]|nr:hypothetical protein FQA39_LY04227 [Lamprigera yunnana]